MKKIKNIFIITFLIGTLSIYGQSRGSHEIGLYIGAASFQTDYGQRNHFMSNVGGNIGTAFGIIHYYQFGDYRYSWYDRGNFFKEHFKLRTDISFAKGDLQHFGKWVAPGGNVETRNQLRAMSGTATVYNVGTQLEFYYKDVIDFGLRYYDMKFNPYGGIGVQAVYSKPTFTYSPENFSPIAPGYFDRWAQPGDINVDTRITAAITLNLGTRFAISENSDLFIDARWHYYMSNYIDGLDAHDKYDKYNDWMLLFQFGYIYYLEF